MFRTLHFSERCRSGLAKLLPVDTNQPVVEIDRLSKRYGSLTALDSVS